MAIKILHTADWHLGKRLDHFSRHKEQIEVMNEICEIADNEQVDMVLIAGDLYDSFNPPAESLDLFYKTLHRLTNKGKRAVIAIAGNHDMPERIEAPHPLAHHCGIILSGFPDTIIPEFDIADCMKVTRTDRGFIELSLPDIHFPVRLLLMPYANEIRLKRCLDKENSEEDLRIILEEKWKFLADSYCDEKGVNLLMAHLFFMKKGGRIEEEPEGEKSILHIGGAQQIYTENIPSQIQYTALGHLHRYQTVDNNPCPVVYSSSPLCYSFSEADQKKQVVIIEAEPGKPVIRRNIELKKGMPLKRKKFENPEDAREWLIENQDAYVEITLVTDNFLDGATRKYLSDVHNFIVDIIPEIRETEENKILIDPLHLNESQDIQSLFADYFKYKNKVEPTESMMDLFKELLSEEDKG